MSQVLQAPETRADPTCPECAADAVNVQGIRTCATCGWVER